MTDSPILTPEEYDEMAARAEAASPGPWAIESVGLMDATRSRVIVLLPSDPDEQDLADQEFIACARSDVPVLCAALAAAEERAEQAEQDSNRHAQMFKDEQERVLAERRRVGEALRRVEVLEGTLRAAEERAVRAERRLAFFGGSPPPGMDVGEAIALAVDRVLAAEAERDQAIAERDDLRREVESYRIGSFVAERNRAERAEAQVRTLRETLTEAREYLRLFVNPEGDGIAKAMFARFDAALGEKNDGT